MKTQMRTLLPLGVLAALAIAASPARGATPITILNSGFEVDDVPDNTGPAMTPANWNFSPLVGGAPPDGAANSFVIDKAHLGGSPHPVGIAGAHSGDQYWLGHAVTNTPFTYAILNQDTPLLWSSMTVGDTLSMSYWATHRSDTDIVSGSILTAMWLNYPDGGFNSAVHGPGWFDTATTVAGEWTQYVWNFQVTQAALDAAADNSWGAVNVGIGFADPGTGLGGGAFGSQVAFDDVSLTYTAIPEPSVAGLLGVAGLALILRRRV